MSNLPRDMRRTIATGCLGCLGCMGALALGALALVGCLLVFVDGVARDRRAEQRDAAASRVRERRARLASLDAGRVIAPDRTHDVALLDCDLYVATRGADDWRAVSLPSQPRNYPDFLTSCTSSHLEVRADVLYGGYCRQALGAGGGCAGRSGSFRSIDGIHWERIDEPRREHRPGEPRAH